MNREPVSRSRRAMPAFLRYLPRLTKKQIVEAMTTPAGPDGKGAPVWVPIRLSNGNGSSEAGIRERHPGWWFKDEFSDLTKEEKTAWLELLTLAVASAPHGMVYFCSVGQLAAWLGVNESSMASVLEKAMKRWLIEIREAVFIPVPGESVQLRKVTKAELPESALKLLEEGSKILRYYAMIFPGFHDTEILHPGMPSRWGQATGYYRMKETEYGRYLEEPFRLLRENLAAAKDSGYMFQSKIESPLGNASSIKLPRTPVYHIDSEAEVEDRLSRKFWALLPISGADVAEAAVRLLSARFTLLSMFAEHLNQALPADISKSRK